MSAIELSAIKHNANNDNNGNPRRGWEISHNGAFVGWIDEGYRGEPKLDRGILNIDGASLVHSVSAYPSILPASDYRDFCRAGWRADGIATTAAVPVYGVTSWRRIDPGYAESMRGEQVPVQMLGARLTSRDATRILSRGGVVVALAWCHSWRDEIVDSLPRCGRVYLAVTRV